MLWAQLPGIVVVVVFYGHYLIHTGPEHHDFNALLLLLLFLFGSVRLIARRQSGNLVEDERDHSIASIGARWSNESPSLEVAFRIAHGFGVPLEQIFQYSPPRSRTK
jgi:DNA-binding XRE family transcriptional regulator